MKIAFLFLALLSSNLMASECQTYQKLPGGTTVVDMTDVNWETSYALKNNYSFSIRSIQVGIDSFNEFVQINKNGKEVLTCDKQTVFKNNLFWGFRTVCGTEVEVICSAN